MNKPERALATTDREERLLDVFAERISRQAYPEDDTSGEDEQTIDLRAIWSAVYRNRILIAAILAVALAAGVASILLTTPTYRGVTTVQVEQHSAKVLGTEDVEPDTSPQEAERFLQTQVDIIKSRALASRVAADLNLIDNVAFLGSVGDEPLGSDEPASAKREQVLELLADNLSVTLPRNSRVVSIAFDSRDPAWAAMTANSFAANFIQMNLQRRFDTSSYSREFLQRQLASTKTKLEASERALIDYARGAGLIDASAGASTVGDAVGPRSLTTASLVQLNDAYSQARSLRVQRQQRWEQAQATPLMSLPEVLANPAIQELTQKRAEIEALYQQELQRRKQGHPTVIQAQANLAELNRQIGALAQNLRNSIRDQYLVALKQERALAGNVSQLKGATLAEQDRGVRYNIIKREVDTNRELYNGLLQRFKEVGAQAGITSNNISIVDRAEPPGGPVSPRPATNMALAGLGGVVLAFLLVFLRERFDDSIRAPEDVDRKLNLPLLGVVPQIRRDETIAQAMEDSKSALVEAYQAVRSSVELSTAGGLPSTLLLTSSRQSEGKSTTALALARDLAATGQRILLIDADLRKPSLHRSLGRSNASGLSNLLARHKAADEVIQQTNMTGLHFISSGPLPPNPAQLLAMNVLSDLLSALREQYDVCRGSLLRSDGSTTVAAAGLDELVVVATSDAVLVVPRERSQDTRLLVEAMKASGRDKHSVHPQIHRPWGSYETMDQGERFQTKRIIVKPGQRLSLQRHHQRSEHWIVVRGTALATVAGDARLLQENDSTYIPAGSVHRLENPGKIPLHLIEVQCGPYLGEDDIVRLEDDYGRIQSVA